MNRDEIREQLAQALGDYGIANAATVIVWPEIERLQRDAKQWHNTYQQHANSTDEWLGDLLKLLPGAEDTGMDAWDQIPRAVKALIAERDAYATFVHRVSKLARLWVGDMPDVRAKGPIRAVRADAGQEILRELEALNPPAEPPDGGAP